MDNTLLKAAVQTYAKVVKTDREAYEKDLSERRERKAYYQAWTMDRIAHMTEEAFHEYLSKLWAMRIWGNKEYAVGKIIEGNGFPAVRKHLAALLWGGDPIEKRWDVFRGAVKGMGPATMSELLCHTHPEECLLWNRRAHVGLQKLGVQGLPRYDYQLDGKKYRALSDAGIVISAELKKQGLPDTDLLAVDYFIWEELQSDAPLTQMHKKSATGSLAPTAEPDVTENPFIHNDIRDKLAEIGAWLGFSASVEKKVADGSKVDTVWEATIGNMGRVIYVFEVQTKGSIDSLILNLLKSLNNPAVQGVVAVSDAAQIKTIQKHSAGVPGLTDKLKCWDYEQVLQVHEALAQVNEAINGLGLVPQGF
ncbi:MAG: hypothetical protein P1P84_23990 [Deferrisomatales bacterium]|nr:hypothetical protein [Deferrisomatales bacterium]